MARDRWQALPVLLLITFAACAPPQVVEIRDPVPDTTVGAQRTADGDYVVLYSDRDSFEPRIRSYDIHHTTLDLSFDFAQELVYGTAVHRLSPLRSGTDSLFFNAMDTEIHHVALTHAGWTDTLVVRNRASGFVALPVEPLRDIDTVEVAISYTAHPRRSDQIRGLHFVDPRDEDPSLPTQVWTLSQPEDARYWFPTWDYPNDFMSFTINLTVPDRFQTYANGVLAEQRRSEGLRTDTWEFDQPHVSYLTAFAVGEFVSVSDAYVRADSSVVPLEYVVNRPFAEDAVTIFEETPDMMGVFERRTGLRYPWDNYKQVVVHEFTAGGMEHTTMSTLSSRILRNERARLDNSARNLIAHELVHQWFGNLVTSENWAHLALNEGFADYFEEVYLEDAIGLEEAQEHARDQLNGYLREAQSLRRPIAWYGYDDPYELYDSHTYSKAARVLNQLRFELGEDAWWEGVRSYVRDNRHRNVTADDLQRTMEAASGRDLDWFFEQWVHGPGHPELLIEQTLVDEGGLYEIRVRQTQDTTRTPVFRFDVDFEVHYAHRRPFTGRVTVETADTTFQIGTAGEIGYVLFDSSSELLADIRTQKPLREWIEQAQRSPSMAARYDAVGILSEQEQSQAVRDAITAAVRDPYDLVRVRAIDAAAPYLSSDAGIRRALVGRAAEDPSARVRAAAVRVLQHAPDTDVVVDQTLRDALHDSSYAVTAAAVRSFGTRNPSMALTEMEHLLTRESWSGTVERAIAATFPDIALDERAGAFVAYHSRPERPRVVRRAVAQLLAQPDFAELAIRDSDIALRRLLEDVDEPVRFAAAGAAREGDYRLEADFVSSRISHESSDRVRSLLREVSRNDSVSPR